MKNEIEHNKYRQVGRSDCDDFFLEVVKKLDVDLESEGSFPKVTIAKVGLWRNSGMYFLSVDGEKVQARLTGDNCSLSEDANGRVILFRHQCKTRTRNYRFYYGTSEELVDFQG